MYEAMASFGGGHPTEDHYVLYSQWALGGWGMIITGELCKQRPYPARE